MAYSKEELFGLEWTQKGLSIEPHWTVDVDMNSIKHEVQMVVGAEWCQVEAFAQGAFNKLYTIKTESRILIMRLTLPIDPHSKTESEVATIEWIQRNTTLPVPKIVAYKSHRDNRIGFEWILMTKLPGKTLSSTWRSIGRDAKGDLVRRVAEYMSTLFEHQKESFGNLYPGPDGYSNQLGKVVSLEFLWANRSRYHVSRGPFISSKEWLEAHLSLIEKESQAKIQNPESDESDLEDAERTLRITQKLHKCLDIVFPTSEGQPEPSILHHDDLNLRNILVDDNGSLTGIIDWECVSWVPLWKGCDYPSFLQNRPRRSEPVRDRYKCNEDGEPNSLYWDHLMEYEQTVLRDEFINIMRSLQPGLVKIFEQCTTQRSLGIAINSCDDEFSARDIEAWIETVTSGTAQPYDLRERMMAYPEY